MSQNSRYLCFQLGKEEFAIPLLVVREVLGIPEITPVPQAPPHFVGIMNLRGQVISVMDLRTKLGIKPQDSSEKSIIILDLGGASLGVIVDCVNSVQNLDAESAIEKPSLENTKSNEFIMGVFKKEDHLTMILDIARALSVEDRSAISRNLPKAA